MQTRPDQTIISFVELFNISEAKAQLSAVIERVSKGEEILIGKAGKPVAKIIRYEPAHKNKRWGCLKGKIKIAKDFDEWPEDIARALGMID